MPTPDDDQHRRSDKSEPSHEQLQALFRQPRFECMFLHERGIVLSVNSAVERVLGYTPDEARGRQLSEFAAPEARDDLQTRIDNGFEGHFACVSLSKNGERRVMEGFAGNISLDDRELSIIHCHDITDLQTTRDDLMSSKTELQELEVALRRKDEALKEFLWQLRDRRQQVAFDIQSNVNKLVKPLLRRVEGKLDDVDRPLMQMVTRCLDDLTSPFVGVMDVRFSSLTPRELEICNMIKNGLRSKEIAATLNISIQTVQTQRKLIRRKLGIANKRVNLVTFLNNLNSE